MRLIDADALDKRIYNDVPISTFGSIRRMAAVRELIEEAPTVEPASPWHRVEDEFPKIGKIVLVYDDLDRLSICQLDNRYRWFRQGGGWIDVPYARYWMPLPEPPKEDA